MAVSAHFGRNGNSDDADWVKANKKYKEEKEFIIKALFQKLRLLFNSLKKEDEAAQTAAMQAITDEELQIAVEAASDALADADKDNEKDTNVTTVKAGDADADADAGGDDAKQEEKDEILDGPVTASTSGQTTGITADSGRETGVYDSKEPSAHRMVFISKEKLGEFENLIKDISQWTDLDKNKTYKEEYYEMKLWRLKQEQKYAEILKLVSDNDYGDKKKSYDTKLDVFKKYFGKQFGYLIEQKELARYEEFPSDYRLF